MTGAEAVRAAVAGGEAEARGGGGCAPGGDEIDERAAAVADEGEGVGGAEAEEVARGEAGRRAGAEVVGAPPLPLRAAGRVGVEGEPDGPTGAGGESKRVFKREAG